MNQLFTQFNDWLDKHQIYDHIAAKVILILFGAYLINLLLILCKKKALEGANSLHVNILHAMIRSVYRPLRIGIWLSAFLICIYNVIIRFFYLGFNINFIFSGFQLIVLFVIGWSIFQLTTECKELFLKTNKIKHVNESTVDTIVTIVRSIIVIVMLLTGLSTLGVEITGLLTVGGAGGIVVGLAAKDLLANFFGAYVVYLDKPFKKGEWINSPDKDIEGVVEKVGWRMTRIRSFDKRPIYVPNALFTTLTIRNPSRMSNRRIYEYVGIRYDDIAMLETIVADIKAMLLNHPGIDSKMLIMVNFAKFGPSSLDILIYAFSKTIVWAEFHEVKQDVLFKIADIVAHHKAEFAFPTSTVHLAKTNPQIEPV